MMIVIIITINHALSSAWHLHYIIRHRVTIDHYQFLPYRLLLSFSLRIRINSISDSYKNV